MKGTLKNLGFFSMLIAFIAFSANNSFAQVSFDGKTCVGTWKTIDDETSKEKSWVKIEDRGGKYFAKIEKLLDPEVLAKSKTPTNPTDIVCEKCSGAKANKPILGLEIIWDMEKYSDKYGGGSILDPKKGSEYSCTMWLEDANTLKVRGWWGFIYRTQTWYRVK